MAPEGLHEPRAEPWVTKQPTHSALKGRDIEGLASIRE